LEADGTIAQEAFIRLHDRWAVVQTYPLEAAAAAHTAIEARASLGKTLLIP
jgi:hypothetical protein